MEQPTQPAANPAHTPESGVFGASPTTSSSDVAHVAGGGFSSAATYGDTSGLVPPVQALTGGFVLSPQADPITTTQHADAALNAALAAVEAGTATEANQAVDANAAMAQALAQSLSQTPEELQALAALNPEALAGAEQADAELLAGATQRQGFFVGDVGVMVSYQDGSELTDIPTLYYLPNAPTWFLGMANLHGNMVPVFDLAAYLGVAQEQDDAKTSKNKKQDIEDKRMLLVLAHGADAAGVVVHGIPQRLYIMQEQGMAPDVAPNLLLPHVNEAYFIDNRVWFDLEVSSLLAALEGAMQTM